MGIEKSFSICFPFLTVPFPVYLHKKIECVLYQFINWLPFLILRSFEIKINMMKWEKGKKWYQECEIQ